jgi:hypothetical protein
MKLDKTKRIIKIYDLLLDKDIYNNYALVSTL